MGERTNAFKVVRRSMDGVLVSAVLTDANGGLVYEPGTIVGPEIKHSKLFAFRCHHTASRFVAAMNPYCHQPYVERALEIWSCLIENPEVPDNICAIRSGFPGMGRLEIEAFWGMKIGKHVMGVREIGVQPAPDGSIMGDSIELVEKVWPE